MKIYEGMRVMGSAGVMIKEEGKRSRLLPLRLDLANHSPTGFEWGYAGSGPAQLALALLADAIGDDEIALSFHQRFKWDAIVNLEGNWQFNEAFIKQKVEEYQEKELASYLNGR